MAFYQFFLNLQFSSSVQRPYCAQLGGFKAPSPQNWGRKAGFFKALGSQTSQISLGKHLEKPNFSPCRSPRVLCLTCQGCGTAKEPESISSSCYRADILDMELVLLWPHTLALLVSSRINSSQGT